MANAAGGVGTGRDLGCDRSGWLRGCPAIANSPLRRPTSSGTIDEPLGTPPPEPGEARHSTRSANKLPPILGAPVRPASTPPDYHENVRVAGADRGEPPVPLEPAGSRRPSPGRPGEDDLSSRSSEPALSAAPIDAKTSLPARAIEPARTDEYSPGRRLRQRLPRPAIDAPRGRTGASASAGKFGDRLHGLFGHTEEWFKSDHVFDRFISPVTNPFLFEDPRSLTEVRPIFMYQQIPGGQPDLTGGNIWFFGTQARLAITNRLSFVFHKLGGISVNPGSASMFRGETGFAELWLGPKYTFIRNEDCGRVMAGGLQFQVPVGSQGVFQNTGSLSLVPYLSYAENFFPDCGSAASTRCSAPATRSASIASGATTTTCPPTSISTGETATGSTR